MNDEDRHNYKIQIRFTDRASKLTTTWLDENLKGTWILGAATNCYELLFEYEEDALLTWWKWG